MGEHLKIKLSKRTRIKVDGLSQLRKREKQETKKKIHWLAESVCAHQDHRARDIPGKREEKALQETEDTKLSRSISIET